MRKRINKLRYNLIVLCLRAARALAVKHQTAADSSSQGRHWVAVGVQGLLADAEGDSGYYKARRGGEPW